MKIKEIILFLRKGGRISWVKALRYQTTRRVQSQIKRKGAEEALIDDSSHKL